MQPDQPRDTARPHMSFVHHPVRASLAAAAHAREVVVAGESPAALAIIAGVVLAVVVPLAAVLIVLDDGIAHFV